jgi:NADH-quinone oxidoreductase subunit C
MTEAPKGPGTPPSTLTSFLEFVEETGKVLGPSAVSATSGSVPAWRVPAGGVREAAQRLRDAGWDYLLFMSAVDYPKDNRFEVVYLVSRFADARHLALLADVAREAPAIATVSDIWPAADWHEREAYDMFGIRFEGHPFLRRILLDEEWPGHPLRKDYVDTLHDVRKRPY